MTSGGGGKGKEIVEQLDVDTDLDSEENPLRGMDLKKKATVWVRCLCHFLWCGLEGRYCWNSRCFPK